MLCAYWRMHTRKGSLDFSMRGTWVCECTCAYLRTHIRVLFTGNVCVPIDPFRRVECGWQQTDFLWHRRCCIWMESVHRKERDRMCAQVLQLQLRYHLPWFQNHLCCWLWRYPQGDCRFFGESAAAPPGAAAGTSRLVPRLTGFNHRALSLVSFACCLEFLSILQAWRSAPSLDYTLSLDLSLLSWGKNRTMSYCYRLGLPLYSSEIPKLWDCRITTFGST